MELGCGGLEGTCFVLKYSLKTFSAKRTLSLSWPWLARSAHSWSQACFLPVNVQSVLRRLAREPCLLWGVCCHAIGKT